MTSLSIYLFGNLKVVRNDNEPVKLRPSAKSIFAYLLLQRQSHPNNPGHRRENLVDSFWADNDEQHARRCLSTTLWRLRRELEPQDTPRGTYLLTPDTGEIGFNFGSDHWLDVIDFENKIRQGMSLLVEEMGPADAQILEEAHALFTGELLEDCYDDWVFRERERLNLLYLNSLVRLMTYYETHNIVEKGLACGHKILAVDPLREQVHRRVIRLYMKSGQRAMAIHQYNLCRRTLDEELGISPMSKTQELYSEILSEIGTHSPEAAKLEAKASEPANLQQALSQLAKAMHSLDEAQEQLRQARMVVSRFTDLGYAEPVEMKRNGESKHSRIATDASGTKPVG